MTSIFLRTETVKHGPDSSAVGLAAYQLRGTLKDHIKGGPAYDFRHEKNRCYGHKVGLPSHAPSEWSDSAEMVWNAAQMAELAKSTGIYKKDAKLALTSIGHLPLDGRLSIDDLWELVCLYAHDDAGKHDLAYQVNLHMYGSKKKAADQSVKNYLSQYPDAPVIDMPQDETPDRDHVRTDAHVLRYPDGTVRLCVPHFHLIKSTRRIEKDGFCKRKARDLEPTFRKGKIADKAHPELKFCQFMRTWGQTHGIDLNLTPAILTPTKHLGKQRFITDSEKVEENEYIRMQNQVRVLDKEAVLRAMTENQAVFTANDLHYFLKKNGLKSYLDDDRDLSEFDLIPLADVSANTISPFYSTRFVRDEERLILNTADLVRRSSHDHVNIATRYEIQQRYTMNEEQLAAYDHITSPGGLKIVQGRAGAGKSYMIGAAREYFEEEGKDVIGLAPTNMVSSDMKKDGFAKAATVHSFLWKLDKGKERLNKNSVLVVDEAGMLSNDVLAPLLMKAAEAKAKVILVGDSAQLPSVGRGGMFSVLTEKYGAAILKKINRQKADWQKEASVDFSERRILDGLRAYKDHGCIKYSASTETATAKLVNAWVEDAKKAENPMGGPDSFIYASTNATVFQVNSLIKATLKEDGHYDGKQAFHYDAPRGSMEIHVGDRLQFHENLKSEGIMNGSMGRVSAIREIGEHLKITVEKDDGQSVEFSTEYVQDIAHGWAGTVYRGQGKTQLRAYALYDNEFAWSAAACYVALTRHKASVDLYVGKDKASNLQQLARQIERRIKPGASIEFAEKEELQVFNQFASGNLNKFRSGAQKLWNKISTKVNAVRDFVRQRLLEEHRDNPTLATEMGSSTQTSRKPIERADYNHEEAALNRALRWEMDARHRSYEEYRKTKVAEFLAEIESNDQSER